METIIIKTKKYQEFLYELEDKIYKVIYENNEENADAVRDRLKVIFNDVSNFLEERPVKT